MDEPDDRPVLDDNKKISDEFNRNKADIVDDLNVLLGLLKDRIGNGYLAESEHFCYLHAVDMKSKILGFFLNFDEIIHEDEDAD